MLESQMLPPAPIPLACSKTMIGKGKTKPRQSPIVVSSENTFEIDGEMETDDMSGRKGPPRLELSPDLTKAEEDPVTSYNQSPVENGQDVTGTTEAREADYDERRIPELSPSECKQDVDPGKQLQTDRNGNPSQTENGVMVTNDLSKPNDGYHNDTTSSTIPQRVVNRNSGVGPGSGKPCAKKSFVWKYFNHPMSPDGVVDRGRTQCILCSSQLAFNASGTTTTMLNHLKSRHGDIAENEEAQRRYTRPHKPNNRNSITKNGLEVSEEQLDLSLDMRSQLTDELQMGRSLFGNSTSRMSRNSLSVGQRGRPPGSGRRPRTNKTGLADTAGVALDYLGHAGHVMRSSGITNNNNCASNPDNSVNFFPLNYCTNLTEQQQHTLLSEMIRSAEAASKENNSLTNPSNMLLSNLVAVGMNPGYHPLFQPPPINFDRNMGLPLPLMTPSLGNSVRLDPEDEGMTKVVTVNCTKPAGKSIVTTGSTISTTCTTATTGNRQDSGESSELAHTPLLSSPCGMNLPGGNPLAASWTSTSGDLPLSLLSMPGGRPGQDLLSSSTSSALGVGSLSAVSPLAASTLTVSPPSSSSSGGQNMSSPAGQQPAVWGLKHDHHQQQSSGVNCRRENWTAEEGTLGADGNIYGSNKNNNNNERYSPIPLLFNTAAQQRTASAKSTNTSSRSNSIVNNSTETGGGRMNLPLSLFGRSECPPSGDSSLVFNPTGINLSGVMPPQALGGPAGQSTLHGTPGTDLASTFGRFMNLMPNMMGAGGGNDCSVAFSTSSNSSSSQAFVNNNNNYAQQVSESLGLLSHPGNQQQQQLMAANAWLTSLANGCPPGALMDQSTVLSLLTGSVVNSGQSPMSLKRSAVTGYKENTDNCLLSMGHSASITDTSTKTTDSNAGDNTTCLHPPSLGNLPTLQGCQDPLDAVSNQLVKCALNGLTGVGGEAWPSPFPFVSTGNPISGSFPNSSHDSLMGGIKQGIHLPKTKPDNSPASLYSNSLHESLDLSKHTVPTENSASPGSGRTPSPGTTVSSTGQVENGATTPASMKRKRARPVYISPSQSAKRRPTDVESVTSWTSDHHQENRLASNDKRLNEEVVDDGNSPGDAQLVQIDRGHFLYQLAHFLVKDMRPPELLEGKGFSELMSIMTNHTVPTASEMRQEVLAKLASTIATDLRGVLTTAVQDVDHQEMDEEVVSGNSRTDTGSRPANDTLPSANTPPPSVAVAMSVELWSVDDSGPTTRRLSSKERAPGDQPDLKPCQGNVEVHYSHPPAYSLNSRFYQSVKLTPETHLPDTLSQCRSLFPLGQPSLDKTKPSSNPTLSATNWPCPLVTNRPKQLTELLLASRADNHLVSPTTGHTNDENMTKSADLNLIDNCHDITGGKVDEAAHQQFMVVPCLVSELARAVMSGLRLPEVQKTVRLCQQVLTKKVIQDRKSDVTEGEEKTNLMEVDREPMNGSNFKSPGYKDCQPVLDNNYDLPQTWWEIEALLKRASTSDDQKLADSSDVIKPLLGVLGTMNETLELIHRDDLVLTASMIEPILQNLRQTRLAVCEPADNVGRNQLVESVKAAILAHLNRAYPKTGHLQQCLQLASLLDPRFKDHVEEQSPAAVKLMKSKLDHISELTTSRKCSENSRDQGDNKIVVDAATGGRDGLKSVFGLPCFSRVSLSEADRYLREDPVGLETDPLEWWAERISSYPRLARLAVYYLTIPLTCFSKGRLRPVKTDLLNPTPQGYSMTSRDGLGLPNVFDSLDSLRHQIDPGDLEVYTFLWHNWDLTKPL